jgi:hypothetical protein
MEYIILHSDKLYAILLLISMSIFIRFLLQIVGQRWITTTAHTATLVLLPLLTFIITKVISGNIALSLGMVGALSIVRFRNPVRSPLELSVYFGAITMGIAASVNLNWLIFLGASIGFAVAILVALHFLSLRLLKKPFFTASFTEGNSMSSLEILSNRSIEWLDQSDLLNMKKVSGKEVRYILVAAKFETLQALQTKFGTNDQIISFQLNR